MPLHYVKGAGGSSEVERSLMVRWVVGSILHGVIQTAKEETRCHHYIGYSFRLAAWDILYAVLI